MEIAIGVGIALVIAKLIDIGKKSKNEATLSDQSTNISNEITSKSKQREADELITILIPTISNHR